MEKNKNQVCLKSGCHINASNVQGLFLFQKKSLSHQQQNNHFLIKLLGLHLIDECSFLTNSKVPHIFLK